jgi:hypothetical protein
MTAPLPPLLAPMAASDGRIALSHRWWRIGWRRRPDGTDVFALIGVRSTVVWSGSVAAVPCPQPFNADHGFCPCSLHAPADATGQARALGSIVVGGDIQVLATQSEPTQPTITVAAIKGPLGIFTWCDGAQDGFTLDNCRRTPRLVVPGAGTATALCRRHARRLPRQLRARAWPLKTFRKQLARSLTEYGVDVLLEDGEASKPQPAPRRRSSHSTVDTGSHPPGRSEVASVLNDSKVEVLDQQPALSNPPKPGIAHGGARPDAIRQPLQPPATKPSATSSASQ